MSRSDVGNSKPHIFVHNGWWRVSRHVKPFPHWLWHRAHWQIAQWNDKLIVKYNRKRSLQT